MSSPRPRKDCLPKDRPPRAGSPSAIVRGRTTRKDIENAVGAGDLGGFLQRLEKNYGIKRNAENISFPVLETKRDAFFRAIGEYTGWPHAFKGLSHADLQ